MKSNLHFIVGIWRSGTTLLREVLGMSDAVKIFPEHFVVLNHLKDAKRFNTSLKNQLLEEILSNPDFIHFAKPNTEQLQNNFSLVNSFEEAILTTYRACLSENESANLFLDKNPIYSYYLPELLTLFPKAKFIWMLREPKDNCISRAKHDIQSFKNYTYLAAWWNLTNTLIAEQANKFPDQFLLVPYDLMVQDPQPWIKKITKFLDIDFKPEMLAFESKKEQRITEFVLAAKARDGEITEEYARKKKAMWENLQKPINTSKTKQWEQEMTGAQIKAVDRLSLGFYQDLIQQNFKSTPKSHSIYTPLSKLSLAKLKWDIERKKLS